MRRALRTAGRTALGTTLGIAARSSHNGGCVHFGRGGNGRRERANRWRRAGRRISGRRLLDRCRLGRTCRRGRGFDHKCRRKLDSLGDIGDGVLEVAFVRIGSGAIVVGGGVVRIKFDRLIEVGDCLVVVAFRGMGDAAVAIGERQVRHRLMTALNDGGAGLEFAKAFFAGAILPIVRGRRHRQNRDRQIRC
ncbi:MAG TPA: hypothetical protein VFI48_03445 [Hyphomicrobiaceae bacterium]|nr:hypothetical protein [Hyphomicrobiaceae bacterium]